MLLLLLLLQQLPLLPTQIVVLANNTPIQQDITHSKIKAPTTRRCLVS